MKAEESSSLGKSSWYLGAQSMLQQVKAYGLSIANTIKVGEVQNRVFNALAPPTRIDTLGLFSTPGDDLKYDSNYDSRSKIKVYPLTEIVIDENDAFFAAQHPLPELPKGHFDSVQAELDMQVELSFSIDVTGVSNDTDAKSLEYADWVELKDPSKDDRDNSALFRIDEGDFSLSSSNIPFDYSQITYVLGDCQSLEIEGSDDSSVDSSDDRVGEDQVENLAPAIDVSADQPVLVVEKKADEVKVQNKSTSTWDKFVDFAYVFRKKQEGESCSKYISETAFKVFMWLMNVIGWIFSGIIVKLYDCCTDRFIEVIK